MNGRSLTGHEACVGPEIFGGVLAREGHRDRETYVVRGGFDRWARRSIRNFTSPEQRVDRKSNKNDDRRRKPNHSWIAIV